VQIGKTMTSDLLIARKTVWVVVADESRAYVYERKTATGPLDELFSLENEVGRMKAGDLLADRGGRSFDSHGQGRHTMTKEKSGPKKRAAVAFAKDIAQRIGKAVREGTCDEFILISAPRFLGELRDALGTAGNAVPSRAIDKEMVGRDAADIEKLLAD
jgi:protein required for attachment to host cells